MEPSLLKIIADNPALFDAVKKVMLNQIDITTRLNMNLSNEQMGEHVRAQLMGVEAVERAFNEIARHKTPPKEEEKINHAR